MKYRLGVDLGTTFTAASFSDGSSEPTVIGLGNRALQIPSVLFLKPDGEFLVGEAAERRGLTEPDRLAREFKRRIGDHVPILVAGAPFSPQALTAHLLRWVVAAATERMGGPPDEVVLTHPANWGPFRLELLDQVAGMAGLTSARRCTEPEAAAIQYASQTRVAPGDRFAIYDLGGGTFDACVLEKTRTGFRILGVAEGVEHLGGVDFDEAVLRHVLGALGAAASGLNPDDPAVTVGLARLRRDCVEAKEALSSDVDTLVPVALPGLNTTVRVTRAEFELMIRPALSETIAAMGRALRSAQVEPGQLRSILLVGGSSRIPLVSELLTREFGVRTSLDTHPKHDVALGAVRIGREDTDTLPGLVLPLEPAKAATTGDTTAAPTPGLAATTPGTTADQPSSKTVGSASRQEPVSAAPAVALKMAEGPADERLNSAVQPSRTRRRRALIAVAAAALVVLLTTTLVTVFKDPGSQADPALAPAPTPTPSRSPAVKPLVGTHTWASGVKLTLSIQAERFGVRYPYCEDGSCGFADEDDIRVLLTYKVSVPRGLRDRLDPVACPGTLTSTATAPAKVIRSITDSYARPVKAINAGQARTGVLEYSVDKKLRDAAFQLSSTCGDVAKAGEAVVFRGPLPELRKEETPGDVGDEPITRDNLGLRVDQVIEDVKSEKYAALVEVCARRTVTDDRERSVRTSNSWYLKSTFGWHSAEEAGPRLLPHYAYGNLRKGSCVSGWVVFDLEERDTPVTLGYDDGSAKSTWRVAEDRSTPSPEPEPSTTPTSEPPDRGGQRRPTSEPPRTRVTRTPERSTSQTPGEPSAPSSSEEPVAPSSTPS